jgi:hypothetical protein
MARKSLRSFEEDVVRSWMGWSEFRRFVIGSIVALLAGALLVVFGLLLVLLAARLGLVHPYDR